MLWIWTSLNTEAPAHEEESSSHPAAEWKLSTQDSYLSLGSKFGAQKSPAGAGFNLLQ